MSGRDWLQLIGSIITLAGVTYGAWRAGKSSDRAQKAALQSKQADAAAAADASESSAFTRAQAMIERASRVQQEAFDAAMAGMREELAELRALVHKQAGRLEEQQNEIVELQRGRENERRYIQKLLDLLEKHQIVYPQPPSFFD